jgi:acyl-CoA synthetase (AMP-forming)/AMP-acid ligase II
VHTSPGRTTADVLLGRGDDGAVALVEGDRSLSYRDLRRAVDERVDDLALPVRRVVVLSGPASIEWTVTYLALLQGGQVPLLAGEHADRLAAAWAPAATIAVAADGTRGRAALEVVRAPQDPPAADLHPDLALLLSTSGSTGSPKLVRLSHRNLEANADAIVEALGLTDADCGITALPLHYCYGLSVLHSHLAAGARMVTITASVVDPCFADAVQRNGVTSIAGVPHSFDLLDAGGADRLLGGSVRLLTQAGGAMAPEARQRWHRRAAAAGAELVVMYGQTEATARMAYLPPALAEACPRAIGIAIPGGELRIDPVADRSDDVGELVYRGPNVMMGYATEPGDLAAGATLHELRTGDLGRYDAEHGVFEVVGRASRFIKPFGLRIDLDVLEAQLGGVLGTVVATGDDERLVVAAPGEDPAIVVALARDACGLPEHRITVVSDPIPRTASGKVDHGAIVQAAVAQDEARRSDAGSRCAVSTVLAGILGRPALAPTDTFVSAGGDSLSYIEASMRIEQLIGALPEDWQHRPVGELDQLGSQPGRPRVDTTVVLRAAGICAVVATHMHLWFFPGGAHLLLAVVGYNLSRFQLSLATTGERLRAGARTIGRVAVPTVAWVAAMMALGRGYSWQTLTLTNNYLGSRGHEQGRWHFWFIEAFVQLCAIVLLLLAVPAARRADRRWPYAFPAALLAATVALREISFGELDDPLNLRFRTHGVAWFLVLGWLVHRSRTTAQRIATSVLCLVTIPGFFGQAPREAFITCGLLLLIWARSIPLPRRAISLASALAAASMWVLITHFQVWPELAERLPIAVAYPATIAVGVAVWKAVDAGPRWVRRLRWEGRGAPAAWSGQLRPMRSQ